MTLPAVRILLAGMAALLWLALGPAATASAQERKLSGGEVRQLIVGRVVTFRSTCSFSGQPSPEFEIRLAVREDGSYLWRCRRSADGQSCSDPSGRMSPGVWRIDGDLLCTRSLTTNAERENCTEIYKVGAGHESRRVNHPCGRIHLPLTIE